MTRWTEGGAENVTFLDDHVPYFFCLIMILDHVPKLENEEHMIRTGFWRVPPLPFNYKNLSIAVYKRLQINGFDSIWQKKGPMVILGVRCRKAHFKGRTRREAGKLLA